jgi:hypothetical protein
VAGVFLSRVVPALFFLALGPAAQERLWPRLAITPRLQFGLGLLWLAAISSLQSRSAFAGVLAATLLGALASARLRDRSVAIGAVLAGLAGIAIYWLLFSVDKSAPGLRWAYLKLFLERSFEWPWVLSGRSYSVVPDGAMTVPGLEVLPHSHNDLLQVLFFWGLPVALVYLLFLFALLRLAWRDFWRQGRPWPVLAFVTVLPSLLTDLGCTTTRRSRSSCFSRGCAWRWRSGAPRSGLEPDHLLALLAQPFDAERHHVALLQVERRLHAQAHAGRRAGGDDVAGQQRHEVADVAHQLGDVEDHGAVLPVCMRWPFTSSHMSSFCTLVDSRRA